MNPLPQDPHDSAWGVPPLPEKVIQFRSPQVAAIAQIVQAFEGGARVVVLEAPTGSGKTVVAECVRRALGVKHTLYMCVDRALQDQFVRDFTYAKVLKGRRNYPTRDYPERFELAGEDRLTADDCAKERGRCPWCDPTQECPYTVAKTAALGAPLACVNTAYFLTECNGPGAFSGGEFVIADEADRLESAVSTFAEFAVSRQRLFRWGVTPLAQDASAAMLMDWLEDDLWRAAERELARYDPESRDYKERRRYRQLRAFMQRIVEVADGLRQGWWVQVTDPLGVTFKPIYVSHVAPKWLWEHAERWLVMSATVLNAGRMLRDLGIAEDWAVVRMPSMFPAANRPIHARAVANVTRDNEDLAVQQLARELRRILAAHLDGRILVHTVSYRLMNRLADALGRPERVLTLEGSSVLQSTLAAYMAEPNSVLLAPALERGLDLADDACRVIVICKMFWPNMGDAQVAARMAMGPEGRDWYVEQCLRSLVQATGRGVRHANDRCISYILDAQFERIARQYWRWLPDWWREAVIAG